MCRIKLSGLRPPGQRPPHLKVVCIDLERTLWEGDIDAPEDKPIVVEFPVYFPAGWHELNFYNTLPGPFALYHRNAFNADEKTITRGTDSRLPWQIKVIGEDGRPLQATLMFDWLEWEGPVRDELPPAHRVFTPGPKDLGHARDILTRFATRAFRRPATRPEVDRLLTVVDAQLKLGDGFEPAVKAALLAVLCSKDFLHVVEGAPGRRGDALTGWELASRLSYFLWSTMPDDRLFALAKAGTLQRPDVLRAEVRRMLADPKAARFAESFPRQWLQLRHVGMFPPDKNLYPEYDDHLQNSMVKETTGYFAEVLNNNLSLREFLASDWTVLNARLADHYGVPGVDGDHFRRVSLAPEHHRGGLLTQAAVLSQTSDGRRHRPVHRGKWVLEAIVGKPPAPPPPNVKPIEPTPPGQKKETIREKLARHTQDANCAGCHKKIDPLGLAFDNYDAIGRWRTVEVSTDGSGDNPPVDAAGVLADGRKFAGPDELKRLLAADLDTFAAAFTEKLAIYALRRAVTPADRRKLAEVTARTTAGGHRLRSLVEELVASDVFRNR